MTITIPRGRPNHRFIRYVRPPTKDSDTPLFPLRPGTRPLRLGIDIATVPAPPAGYLTGFLTRDEIEVHLLVAARQDIPAVWTDMLHEPVVHEIGFSSVDSASRFCDAVEFTVSTTRGEDYRAWTKARFFDVYQRLDDQDAPSDAPPLTLDQRHRAAAYAAAAGAVGVDAIVTNAPTVGRADVADNDLVVGATPDDAVALVGHYLRVTGNPVVGVQRGALLGGTWETTETAATVANLYDWGTVSGMPYFDCSPAVATSQGDIETAVALRSVRVRLSRAARALDHMLAALSSPVGGSRGTDVVEAAAEAFDRELLYLAAAFDIYGRLYMALLDPSPDRASARGSLDSREFLKKQVRPQYDESLLTDVTRLQVYAYVCKQLRNHIHDGILPVDQHPGRNYGNTMNVALDLGRIPKLAPGADNGMGQDHFDALGVWQTEPVRPFDSSSLVADLATTGFMLMGAALEYVEEFTKLILRNKPAAAAAPSSLLGCVQARPGEVEPPPPDRAVFHQALFGWHPTPAT
jgi:hypothetical protein